MFWGLIMEPNKRYTQTVERPFHVSMATLDISTSDNSPVQVMLCYENRNYLLCNLNKDKTSQVPLDLNFQEGTQIAFTSNGRGHVHLTGYLIPEDEDLDELEDGSEEEEEEDDEEVPQLVGKSKKRKAESPEDAQMSLKKLKALLNSSENDEDDSDDDDEDGSFDENFMESLNSSKDEDASDEEAEEEEDDEEFDEEEVEDEEDEDDDEDEEDETEAPVEQKQKGKQNQNQQKNNKQEAKEKAAVNGKDANQQKKNKKEQQPQQNKKEQQPQQNKKEQEKPQQKKDNKQQNEQQQQVQKKRVLTGGVQIEELTIGSGQPAKNGKFVSVYYVGKLKNGKKFDATQNGAGFKFRLGGGEVIKGWDIGVAGMKVGGKRRITVPAAMGYGQKGSPPVIPPNSLLIFDVELKKVH